MISRQFPFSLVTPIPQCLSPSPSCSLWLALGPVLPLFCRPAGPCSFWRPKSPLSRNRWWSGEERKLWRTGIMALVYSRRFHFDIYREVGSWGWIVREQNVERNVSFVQPLLWMYFRRISVSFACLMIGKFFGCNLKYLENWIAKIT